MVSGPPRGIFKNSLLFFHSTPCFFGKFALFFPEFCRFSACSPRAQRPFWTPRCPTPSCRKVCVKPGRWGKLFRKKRFLVPSGLVSEIGGGQKRDFPVFSKKMVSGPWRFSEIRPIFAYFRFFSKITPKIGVFPPKIGYFRVFSGFFWGFPGPVRSGPAATRKFREIFGKFPVRRRLAGGPPWTPLGPGLDPIGTRFRVPPGPIGVPFGVRLGSVWDPIWDPVWGPIWTLWRPMETLYGPYMDPMDTFARRFS